MTGGLGKQAKVLTDKQLDTLMSFVSGTNYSSRNRVIVALSFYAGLRAKEIANLKWGMVMDAEGKVGEALALENSASKGKSGRVIPLHRLLQDALIVLLAHETEKGRVSQDAFVITLQKKSTDAVMRAQSVKFLFRDWYSRLNLTGASSHSGRRHFITRIARQVGTVGGSIRDVQATEWTQAIVFGNALYRDRFRSTTKSGSTGCSRQDTHPSAVGDIHTGP